MSSHDYADFQEIKTSMKQKLFKKKKSQRATRKAQHRHKKEKLQQEHYMASNPPAPIDSKVEAYQYSTLLDISNCASQ